MASYNIGQDGKLVRSLFSLPFSTELNFPKTFARTVSTQGCGAAANAGAPAPDPLLTQDAVKVGGNHLYTVNVRTSKPKVLSSYDF